MSLVAEALWAVTGFDHRGAVSPDDGERAIEYVMAMDKRAAKLPRGGSGDWSLPRAIDVSRVWREHLAVADPAAEQARVLTIYDDDEAREYVGVWERARQHLAERWPLVATEGLATTTHDPPAASEAALSAELWRAVTNPLAVLADVAAGVVTSESVEALAAVFPALLERARTTAYTEITAHPDRRIERDLDLALRVFFDAAPDDALDGMAAATVGGASPPPAPPAPRIGRAAARLMTDAKKDHERLRT